MNNIAKIAKVIVAGVILGGLGFLVSKSFKKEVKNIKDKEDEESRRLQEQGINKDIFEREMIPGVDDNNLVKALFISMNKDPEWDVDWLDTQGCIDCENVIHLGQTDTDLNIYMEIPQKKEGNYRFPVITDFIRILNDEKKNLEKSLSSSAINVRLHSRLDGYIAVSFKNIEGKTIWGTLKICPGLYGPYRDERYDGFVKFVDCFRKKSEEDQIEEIVKSNCYNLNDITDLKIWDIKVFYCMSINKLFVDINKTKNILEQLMEVEVKKESQSNPEVVKYNHIMFNTVGPAGNWSPMYFYDFREVEKKDPKTEKNVWVKTDEVITNVYTYGDD